MTAETAADEPRRPGEVDISRAILDAYHEKIARGLEGDVAIVGAGPSGLVAGWKLAARGLRVVILEKRLAIGGGIWGGSIGMNEAVVQDEALGLLDEAEVRYRPRGGGLHTVDTAELASALCLQALRAGATLLNLLAAEDLCVRSGRVVGVVAGRTALDGNLPIDPIVFASRATIDATGHEAFLVRCLARRGLLKETAERMLGEGPMDAAAGERFVVDHVTEIYPGLWTTGMSVCASQGGPRMGPIFGGMLLSGRRVADLVAESLAAQGG